MVYARRIFFITCLCLCIKNFCAAQSDSSIQKTNFYLPPDSCLTDAVLNIADIHVTGNRKTKEYIILRETPFNRGSYLHENEIRKKLLLARDQILNTQLFVYVQVYISKRDDYKIDINIDVKERWYLFPLPYFKLVDRNVNEWWVQDKASFNRVNYGVNFTQNNVSGRNDNLNASIINGYNRQVNLKYIQPFANNSLKKGFEASMIYSGQHEINYVTDQNKPLQYTEGQYANHYFKIEGSYLYTPAIKTRHIISVGYIVDDISDSAFHLNPYYFPHNAKTVNYPYFAYTLQYMNVNNIGYPTKGLKGDFSFIKNGLTSSLNLWQFETHISYTIPVQEKSQVQFSFGGILKLPFRQTYYSSGLFGYGDIYLQGLEYYVIDGVAGGVFRSTFRRQIASFNLNTHLKSKIYNKIPFRFYAKIFNDEGYTYNPTPGNSFLNNHLLFTNGFGLDIVTIYDISLRLEYSFNQYGGNGLFIHTGNDF